MKEEEKEENFDEQNTESEAKEEETHNCGCAEGKECTCGDDCKCGDTCTCHEHDHEHKHHKHHHDHECCHHNEELAGQYLEMAQRLQADFDNYRKHVAEQLEQQREEGKRSVIEVFLPCLDTFKEAKKNIEDEKILSGINMIEDKITKALASLQVEKIETVGQKFDHNLHEVIAVSRDENQEEDIILDEFQAGYTLNGKVIRYSKVIVNKLD